MQYSATGYTSPLAALRHPLTREGQLAARAALRYALRLLPADLYYYNYIAQPWDRDRRIRRCLTASDDTLAQPGACCPTTLLRYRYVKSERGLSRPHHNGGMTADFVAHVRSLEKTMLRQISTET